MNVFQACYKLHCLKDVEGRLFIKPLCKVGNSLLLNLVFLLHKELKVCLTEPIAEMFGYHSLNISIDEAGRNSRKLMLQIFPDLLPFGVVKASEGNDCMVYSMNGDSEIEIFVSQGNVSHTAQIFQMFKDGALSEEIEAIREKMSITMF